MRLDQHIGALERSRFGTTKASIQKVAQEFEGLLITQLLKVMRKSIPESGMLGGGAGKSIYQSMFDLPRTSMSLYRVNLLSKF